MEWLQQGVNIMILKVAWMELGKGLDMALV